MNYPPTRKLRLSIILAITFFAAILLVVSLALVFRSMAPKAEYTQINRPGEEDLLDADFENQGKWYGLCSKNSIRSIEDFRKTVEEDEALKTHYAGFNWEKARLGNLQSPTLAYVYFKKDGKIFRKEKPIKLPAGDGYITDGNRTLRTYCCNDYTPGPPLAGSPDLGAAATASAPAQSSSSPSSGSGLWAMAGGWMGGGSDGGSDRPVHGDTPEIDASLAPAAIALLSGCLLIFRSRFKRK